MPKFRFKESAFESFDDLKNAKDMKKKTKQIGTGDDKDFGAFMTAKKPNTIYIEHQLLAERPANAVDLIATIATAKEPADLVAPLKMAVEFAEQVDAREKQFKDAVKQIKDNFAHANEFYDSVVKAAKDVALKHYLSNATTTQGLDTKTGELKSLVNYDHKIAAFVISKPANTLSYDDQEILDGKAFSKYVKVVKAIDRQALEHAILSGEISPKQLKSLKIIESDPRVSFYPGKL